ncbi:methyltransferase domain-containing protein [Streptomyces alkaliphilus]|uniref:Methyltransferase domain-containing protein n=1 Tax=Streptomyces alkaliphilus TaxID=1472722 RepID=A0A7W3TEB7_9ACTN|nr:class I SAM-dependent methyltransferase [Streptomyces alkaliphilus]MBB0245147.1 methyltransferase domain-containing protein [Streptomyces alkaliphilus]
MNDANDAHDTKGAGGASGERRDRWAEVTGAPTVSDRYAEEYAARFARLAAEGGDPHGEARFCDALLARGSRVLDAGCGTGRVAARLAELGHSCTGVDVDPAMLAVARRTAPGPDWHLGDLVALDAVGLTPGYDLVVAAGNVIPLLAPGTEVAVIAQLARLLRPGGLLVAGMGLTPDHLPLAEAPFGAGEYDEWCAAAGLERHARYSTWDGSPFEPDAGYLVAVHARPAEPLLPEHL